MKKRILCAILAAMMTASVTSCGSSKDSSGKEKSTAASDDADKTSEESSEENEESSEAEASSVEKTTADEEKTSGSSGGSSGKADFNDYITNGGAKPALWKATDPETGNELYLMGTIHVKCDDTIPLPDYIMDVYDKCSGVAVEYDIVSLQGDMEQLTEYYTKMVYQDGTTISDHISEETYKAARKILKDEGVYNQMLDYYCPGFWISSIQSLGLQKIENLDLDGIDVYFINKAEDDGKEVINIETLDIQASVSTGYSDALADFMLRDTVNSSGDIQKYAEDLAGIYDLWAKGDIDSMEELEDSDEEIPEELEDDYVEYEEIAVYKRNAGMAEKAAEYLKDGKNYFFMVGALHFAGDRGVDDILEDMGYTVERIK